MKRIAFILLLIVNCQLSIINCLSAQTDVTSKYIDNPNFEARFAGWVNTNMTFNTSKNYDGQDGMVFMEKWVSAGNKLNSTASISQVLEGLTAGTYTLTANAQNIQQNNKEATQTGAFLYAGDEQTEVSASGTYSVTFTVVSGKAEIGFKLQNCTGNWACVDNFLLTYDGLNPSNINAELQKLITEAEGVVGSGVTGPALQTAIDNAKSLAGESSPQTAETYQTTAKALIRATLEYRISNATGAAPKVTTWDFVPTGVTIALGRMTATGSGIKERGFCWSTEPEPTVLDNRSTRYFSENGNIYCLEHLQPATIYYVRPYAMTNGYQVGYGDVVKIATLPESNMTVVYDNAGDEQTNFRIASAVNEVYWLYHHLTNVRGFNLNVHYVPGAGTGDGTADCSYGGWMRVSQNTPYQQTGTILHETNHGVGVGTTGEWYNNSNLRAETSRGLWLGPRANQMVQFLKNDKTATLTGDGTHMWPYGINGAHEDSYNPENTILYYANAMTTHALHQDGLICSSSVGFATPAYVFQQDDETKYYIKSEDENAMGYLTMSNTGILRTEAFDADNADNFAWNITYDPKNSYYIFRNVGTGKYMTYSSSIRATAKETPTAAEKFHLLPARAAVSMGSFTGTGYWITKGSGAALEAGTTSTSTKTLDFSNAATSQRWLFLTADQLDAYNQEAVKLMMAKLNTLLANVRTAMATPHVSKSETTDVNETDEALTAVIDEIEKAKAGYTTPGDVTAGISQLETALIAFLGKVTPESVAQPFDLTFLLVNPGLDSNSDGWSTAATNSYSCCEFFETTFDFNQTTTLKMPAGTYELRVQAFQRPGSASDTYTDFVTNATDKVTTQIYLKTKYQKVKNIWADAQSRSLGGSTSNSGGKYVPNNMLAASKWFAAGWYDNSVLLKTTTAATMKLGIRSTTSNSSYWTTFDNFRLYYYGGYTTDDVTPVDAIEGETPDEDNRYFDLSGRRISKPTKGLYIVNGRKVFLR